MNRIRIPSITILLVLALMPYAETAERPLRSQFSVSIEAVLNPVEGSARSLCRAVDETGQHRKLEWWVAFGEAKAPSREHSQETGDHWRSGCGSLEKTQAEFESMSQDAYLVARVSSAIRILYEGPLALEVSLSVRKLSGFGSEGEAIYTESVERRKFLLSPDSRDVVIPLLVATDAEQEALGVREVVLMLKVEVVTILTSDGQHTIKQDSVP